MRKRNQPPILLVDDASPHGFSEDAMSRFSVDLARTSFGSVSAVDDGLEVSPDLAVLEELESIRTMIERKSKDLTVRERSLSKSISNWNSEVSIARELVEELAENLFRNGQKELEELVDSQSKRVKKMLQSVESRLKGYERIASKFPSAQQADVPPLPHSNDAVRRTVDSDMILSLAVSDARCTPKQVAAVCLLIVSHPTFSDAQEAFVLTGLLTTCEDYIRGHFDSVFSREFNWLKHKDAQLVDSRFESSRKSILRRRLGVFESAKEESISVTIQEDSMGSASLVDVHAELDGDYLSVWTEATKGFENDYPLPMNGSKLAILTDPAIQFFVCRQLKSKLRKRSYQSRLVDLLLLGAGDRAHIEAMTAIVRQVRTDANELAKQAKQLVVILLFLLHRSIEEAKSQEIMTAIHDCVTEIMTSRSLQPFIREAVGEWAQGQWFMMSCLFKLNKSDTSTPAHMTLLSLLEAPESLISLAPWKDGLLEKIGKSDFPADVLAKIKPLAKRMAL